MKRVKWGKACLLAATLTVLAGGQSRGEQPPVDPSQIVVIREAGKPDRRCLIEQSHPQADGKVLYFVRDLATGERLRVLDARAHRDSKGPIVGTAVPKPNDDGMLEALASSPFNDRSPHEPTTAELAGAPARTAAQANHPQADPATKTAANGESALPPVQIQLKQLKNAASPSERELAAMTLALSDARRRPEVVQAIMDAARSDAAAAVRAGCVRCLYRMSPDSPQVVAVIETMQNDANQEVSETARKAMQEISKRGENQPKR